MSYWHELEREYTELQQSLIDMTAEKERCRKLAVENALKTDGYKASLEMCENMKLAHEFEELLQTTSIPIAVNKLKEIKRQLAEAEELMKWFCRRVEIGEVRSVKTYAKFKEFLTRRNEIEHRFSHRDSQRPY